MWKKILLGALILIVAVAGFFVWRIGPRNIIGIIKYDQRREGTLTVGDAAPDAAVVAVDDGKAVRLSSFFGKRPVVLVFGSFT